MSIREIMTSDERIRRMLSEWKKKQTGKHDIKFLDIVVERAYNQYRSGTGVPYLNQLLEKLEKDGAG